MIPEARKTMQMGKAGDKGGRTRRQVGVRDSRPESIPKHTHLEIWAGSVPDPRVIEGVEGMELWGLLPIWASGTRPSS